MKQLIYGLACLISALIIFTPDPLKSEPIKVKTIFELGGSHALLARRSVNSNLRFCSNADRELFVRAERPGTEISQKDTGNPGKRDVLPRGLSSERSEVYEQIRIAAVREFGEAEDVLWIVGKESGFNRFARNGNCCGLFQRLNHCDQWDINAQIEDGLKYIKDRYGLPSRARAFWIENKAKTGSGWY